MKCCKEVMTKIPPLWYRWSLNGDCCLQYFWMRCTIAETCIIGSSILALWSLQYTDHDRQQKWWDHLISAIAIPLTIGPLVLLFWGSTISLTMTSSCYQQRNPISVLSATKMVHTAFWSWIDIIKGDQEWWYWLESNRIVLWTSWFLRPAF